MLSSFRVENILKDVIKKSDLGSYVFFPSFFGRQNLGDVSSKIRFWILSEKAYLKFVIINRIIIIVGGIVLTVINVSIISISL